jgi:6-pyruvoyltetrahydropterin/6-carboxytetrahydropterin synthase
MAPQLANAQNDWPALKKGKEEQMLIYKEFTFEAAHHLPHAFPDGHPNHRIHGHSFRVRVTLQGTPNKDTGLIADLSTVKKALQDIQAKLDHKYLNEDIPELDKPTLEMIVIWIWRQLKPTIPQIIEVSIHRDTCQEGCIYNGDLEGVEHE